MTMPFEVDDYLLNQIQSLERNGDDSDDVWSEVATDCWETRSSESQHPQAENKSGSDDRSKPEPGTKNSVKEQPFKVGYKQVSFDNLDEEEIERIERDIKPEGYTADSVTGPVLVASMVLLGYKLFGSTIRTRLFGSSDKNGTTNSGTKNTTDFTSLNRKIVACLSTIPSGNTPADVEAEKQILAEAAAEIAPAAKEIAKRLGLPEDIINNLNVKFGKLRRFEGVYRNMNNEITIDYRNHDPINVLEHELKHMQEAIYRTALRRVDPVGFNRLIRESCFSGIETIGLNQPGNRVTGLNERTEFRKLIEAYYEENGIDLNPEKIEKWLAGKNISPELIRQLCGRSQVAVAFSSELKHIENCYDQACIPDDVLARPENAKLAEFIQTTADRFTSRNDGMLAQSPAAQRLMRSYTLSTRAIYQPAFYCFSPEEIRTRRFEASRELSRCLNPENRFEPERIEYLKQKIKYGNLQEQILEKLRLSPSDQRSLAEAKELSKQLLQMSNADSSMHLDAVKFLKNNGLLAEADIKGTAFENKLTSKPQKSQKPHKADQLLADFEISPLYLEQNRIVFDLVEDFKKLDKSRAEQFFEPGKTLADGSTEYRFKRPITLYKGSPMETTYVSVVEKNGELTPYAVEPGGTLEFKCDSIDATWFEQLKEAMSLYDKVSPLELRAGMSLYLEKLEARQKELGLENVEKSDPVLEALKKMPAELRKLDLSKFNPDLFDYLEFQYKRVRVTLTVDDREIFSETLKDYKRGDARVVKLLGEKYTAALQGDSFAKVSELPNRTPHNLPIAQSSLDIRANPGQLKWWVAASQDEMVRRLSDTFANIDERIERAMKAGLDDLAAELSKHKKAFEKLATPQERLAYLKSLGEKCKIESQHAINSSKSGKGSLSGKINGIAGVLIIAAALRSDNSGADKNEPQAPKVTPLTP